MASRIHKVAYRAVGIEIAMQGMTTEVGYCLGDYRVVYPEDRDHTVAPGLRQGAGWSQATRDKCLCCQMEVSNTAHVFELRLTSQNRE